MKVKIDFKIAVILLIIALLLIVGFSLKEIVSRKKVEVQPGIPKEVKIPPVTTKETRPEAVTKIEKLVDETKIIYPVEVCEPKDFSLAKGKIYISTKPVNKEKIGIYFFDIKDRQMKEFLVDEYNNWGINFSKDGKMISFISERTGTSQVFIANSDGTNIQQVTKSSNEENVIKTRPVFSPDGKEIVFTNQKLITDVLPDGWDNFLTDLRGKEEFLIEGVFPLFSPDGKYMLIIKNAGVYLLDLEKKELERVIELRDEKNELILGRVSMKASLSPDGKQLAIADYDKELLLLFKITSWNPFTYKLKGMIKTTALWNVFSPDGNFLAFWGGDLKKEEKEGKRSIRIENPRLVILETCNLNNVFTFSLEEFDPGATWITDWRE